MFLLIKGTEEKINICNNNKEGVGGSTVGLLCEDYGLLLWKL